MEYNLKKLELDVLLEFDGLCKKHNLRYSLAYGTMLGAIRHKGFIPWDDDVDVVMPRKDYEKLMELSFESENYIILNYLNSNYFYPFAKMCDKRYKLYETYRPEKNLGPYIDIFPLDYLSDDFEHRKKQIKSNKSRMSKVFRYTCSYKSVYKGKNTRFLKKAYLFFQSIFVSDKKRKKFLSKLDLEMKKNTSKYMLNMVFSDEGENAILCEDDFNNLIEISFEGYSFCCINDYDRYLTGIYGNYMKLPPIEKQISNHNFIIEENDEYNKKNI